MPGVRRLAFWFLPSAVGIAAAALFAFGAVEGLSGRLGQPVGDAPPAVSTPASPIPDGALRIVALGDSLTRGAGDDAGGYAERVARMLRSTGQSVSLENLGVDGAETGDLLRKVSDPETRRQIAGAQLILMSISGNDLSHSVRSFSPAGGGGAAGVEGDPMALRLRSASLNLLRILSAVREANGSAPIRLLGLYDPFTIESGDRRLTREVLLKWNVALEEASYTVPGAVVVPTADLFEDRADRLSGDRFHPGPTGYAEIAARVVSTLRVAPAATPAARRSPG